MNEFKTSRFLLSYLRRHWFQTTLLVLIALSSSLAVLLPPLVLRNLFDHYFSANPDPDYSVLLASLSYFGSYLLIALLNFGQSFLVDSMGQGLIRELRMKMIVKIRRLKPGYFTRHGTGEMTSRVMDDVSAVETLFSDGLVSLVVSALQILTTTVSVFLFGWALGLLLLLVIPLLFLITQAFRKGILKAQLKVRSVQNRESNALSESIDTSVTVHNLGKRGYREEKFDHLLREDDQAQKKAALFDSFYPPLLSLLKSFVVALVTFLVVYRTSASSIAGLSVGTFAAAIDMVSNLFKPIQDLGQEIQTVQEGFSGIKRVEKFLNENEIPPSDETLTGEKVLFHLSDDLLVFDHLTFRYEDASDNLFDGASYTIHRYDQVSLTGRTGIGKTTLFKLILGLLPPTEGEIRVNGVKTTEIPDSEKKKIFGYVAQGFSPVPGTIFDQVTLGDTKISREAVFSATKEALLDDYIRNRIPGGYEAPFRESDFSRGQLQLLSLARALVNNPPILLLDEISANLDSQTEKQIIQALSSASRDRTVVSISHRLSDQLGFKDVLVVENGKIRSQKNG